MRVKGREIAQNCFSVGPRPMPSTARQTPELRIVVAIDSKRKQLTRMGLAAHPPQVSQSVP